tara:strand:+ start:102888 stop:103880 length:993 start_codon:yes stop_codon:yes gene_type:complete
MAAFKPPADTLVGKILKNATAVFFFVILALFAGTFYFFKTSRGVHSTASKDSKKFSLSQRQYVNEESTQVEVTGGVKEDSNSNASQTPPNTAPQPSTAAAAADSGKDIKHQTPEEIRQHLENQLFKKDPVAAKDETATRKYELKIYFAEVSQKGLDILAQEARANGQMNSTDFAQGVMNIPMTRVLSYRDDFNAYTELSKTIEKDKPTEWFQGLKSSGVDSDVGITHTVTVKDSPNGRLQLEVKVIKRFQVGGQDSGAKSYQNLDYIGGGEIDVDSDRMQTYYMAEILSKFPMTSQQEYLTAISPFEIFKSQNFLGGKTFSVFFYTIENK